MSSNVVTDQTLLFGAFVTFHLSQNAPVIKLSVMNTNQNNKPGAASDNSPKKTSLLTVSAIGAARAVVGLPLEHPFDTLKTWMQSENVRGKAAIQQIYDQKGLRGFYSGFWVSMLRWSLKQAYRWPLNIYLIDRFRTYLPDTPNKNGLAGVLTGVTTALLESFIICPLERVKVWLMTTHNNRTIGQYLQAEGVKGLMKGLNAVLLKQTLSWVSFLGSQEYLKDCVYRYKGKTRSEYTLTTTDLLLLSVLVCFCNTLVVMPADYVKTRYQKFEGTGLRLTHLVRQSWQEQGLRGFYRGGAVKILHYNVNTVLTVPLFERLLREYSY